MVHGIHNVVNFKDFSRPHKQITYFWRTSRRFKDLTPLSTFNDFSRGLLRFRAFSRFYAPFTAAVCDTGGKTKPEHS